MAQAKLRNRSPVPITSSGRAGAVAGGEKEEKQSAGGLSDCRRRCSLGKFGEERVNKGGIQKWCRFSLKGKIAIPRK